MFILFKNNITFLFVCKFCLRFFLNPEFCLFPAEKELDIIYEVVFDEPFAGGLNLRSVSLCLGYLLLISLVVVSLLLVS